MNILKLAQASPDFIYFPNSVTVGIQQDCWVSLEVTEKWGDHQAPLSFNRPHQSVNYSDNEYHQFSSCSAELFFS